MWVKKKKSMSLGVKKYRIKTQQKKSQRQWDKVK